MQHILWDDFGKSSPVFAPDCCTIAYSARKGADWFVVVNDDVVAGPYEGLSPGGICFSEDSKRMAFVVKRGSEWVAVVDGREESPFPTIVLQSWLFSPDASRFAYVAAVNDREAAVVIDGDVQKPWAHDERTIGFTGGLIFSPDSKRLAYGVVQKSGFLLRKSAFTYIIDGVSQRPYDGLCSGWERYPNWAKFPDYGKV